MAEYQSSYSRKIVAHTAGLIPEKTPGVDVTKVVEDAALPFGVGVKRGANSDGASIFDDEDGVFIGVSVRDVTLEDADDDQYPVAQEATVRCEGPVIVTASSDVSVGDPAYVAVANGLFSNVTPGSPIATVRAGTSYFMEAASSGDLVRLWVSCTDDTAGIVGIVLSANLVDKSDSVGTVIGSFFALGGTGGETFSLTSNPGAYFRIDDDRDLVVDADMSSAPSTVTIGVTTGGFTQSISLEMTDTPPPDPPDEEPPVYDAAWTTPPAVGKIGKGRKVVGQKGASRAALIYPLQLLEAESRMCVRLTPDFSAMSNGSDGILLGFGFLDDAGQFHIMGQAWDAAGSEMRIMQAYGSQLGQSTNISVTVDDVAAATNGTSGGPNHQLVNVAADGLGVDFETRDISATVAESYDSELSDVAISPFSDITEPTKFGIGVYVPVGNQGTLSVEIGLFPVTFIGADVGTNFNTTSALSVALPSGASSGDLAIVATGNYAGGSGAASLTGGGSGSWTSRYGPVAPDLARHQTWSKLLDGSSNVVFQPSDPASTTDRGAAILVFRNASIRNFKGANNSGMGNDASVTSDDIKETHDLAVLGTTGGFGAGSLSGGDNAGAATGNDHIPTACRYGKAAGGTEDCVMTIVSFGVMVNAVRLQQLAPVE